MVSFDDPSIDYQNQPFEIRYEHLIQSINIINPLTVSLLQINLLIYYFNNNKLLKEKDSSTKSKV